MPEVSAKDSLSEHYSRDGVVYIRQALSRETLKLAEAAFNWNIENPGPGASEFSPADAGQFYQDLANLASLAADESLLAANEFGQRPKLPGKPSVIDSIELTQDKNQDLDSISVHPLTRARSKPLGTPFRDKQFPRLM